MVFRCRWLRYWFLSSISDKATEADAAVAKALGAAPAAEFANVNKWLAEVK
jgi:hypothetical protein